MLAPLTVTGILFTRSTHDGEHIAMVDQWYPDATGQERAHLICSCGYGQSLTRANMAVLLEQSTPAVLGQLRQHSCCATPGHVVTLAVEPYGEDGCAVYWVAACCGTRHLIDVREW